MKSDGAENGQIAVNKFRQSQQCCPYRLIFMDINMPVMNGYEATRRIQDLIAQHRSGTLMEADIEDPVSCAYSRQLPQTSIYALTANDTEDDRDTCKQLGITFMPKPAGYYNVKDVLLSEFGNTLRYISPEELAR